MLSKRSLLLTLLLALAISCSQAFVPAATTQVQQRHANTALYEGRRWNFNDGQSPWGLKKNAEIWNGRVAQMAFVVVFVQELVQGKGVLEGLKEGNPINIALAAGVGLTTLGLTGFLALQGSDDFVNQELKK